MDGRESDAAALVGGHLRGMISSSLKSETGGSAAGRAFLMRRELIPGPPMSQSTAEICVLGLNWAKLGQNQGRALVMLQGLSQERFWRCFGLGSGGRKKENCRTLWQ